MRNLAEHPVTREEIVESLLRSADNFVLENRLGDMRGYLHREAVKLLSDKVEFKNKDALKTRCREFFIKQNLNVGIPQATPLVDLYEFVLSEIEEATKIE